MQQIKSKRGISYGSMVCALLLLLAMSGKAQPTDAYTSMRETSTTGIVHCVYYIELADTNSVSEIEIKLSSERTSVNMVNTVFTYDAPNTLPQGFSYTRNGNIIAIDMGEFPEQAAYYGNVRTKSGGNWSSTYTFVSN